MEKKKNTIGIECDRISNLHDSILHHIFSFLNIQEAVKSSVLSKRWRNLWTSLPTLNFDFQNPLEVGDIDAAHIKGFVDKVLILRDGSNIQKFAFLCPDLSSWYVNDWIICALRRNVQELAIELCFDEQYRLPNCFFDSKSLTILNLFSCDSFLELTNIPDSMCLPSLKTMFLHSLSFSDEDATTRFFSSCPVLESLTIVNSMLNQTNLKISSLSLKHLTIEVSNRDGEDFVPIDGSVTLCTPNLISFRCDDYMEKNYYVVENLSSLFKANIFLKFYDLELLRSPLEVRKNMFSQRMCKFLGQLHNVTDLTLSVAIFEVVSGPALLGSNLIYRNLRSLEMDALFFGDRIHPIICLLQMSPAIETLYINSSSTLIEEKRELELSSECLLNHLKVLKRVEIRDAKGSVNELKFLKTLLKNAVVLETLMIVFFAYTEVSVTARQTRFVKFGEKLRAFPKASSSITIMLI